MGMSHDFWLLREGECSYTDYKKFIFCHDAPVRLHDDLLHYFGDTLAWIPTLNPANAEKRSGHGLNWYGPTIINQHGGLLWSQVCTSWAQLFTLGPAQLRLQGAYSWQRPFDEARHAIDEDQLHTPGNYEYLEIRRDWLIQALTTLAQFGAQAATGEFFILHLGI